ncbi:MAG: carbonic anhydrase [Pseudomonadota bacterium]
MSWLREIEKSNSAFVSRVNRESIPVERQPSPYAVITCMDPRVNLDAIGIGGFSTEGKMHSPVRVIRTVGARLDERSLTIGIHLAGIKEIAVLMHTDCGCCLAHNKTDAILENLKNSVGNNQQAILNQQTNLSSIDAWRSRLKTFADPREAVIEEVSAVKTLAVVPPSIKVHGLLYDLATGGVEVVVDGGCD